MAIYKQTDEEGTVLVRADLSQGELETLIGKRLAEENRTLSDCSKENLAAITQPTKEK